MLVQLILGGLSAGSIYALIALALVIVYRTTGIVNFAQGEMAMFTAYLAFSLLNAQAVPVPVAFIAALGFAFVLGFAFEWVVIRRAERPSVLELIILTVGFQLVLFGAAGWVWGGETRQFPFPISPSAVLVHEPAMLSALGAVTLATTVLLGGVLFVFLRFTRTGLAMQATQQNEAAARINGVRTGRVRAVSFGMSSVVGAVAALLLAPTATLDPALMWDPLLKGFAAAVLGGLTSMPGAVLGGLLLGVTENLFGGYLAFEFKSVVALTVIVGVLWFRPAGLLGRHVIRRA